MRSRGFVDIVGVSIADLRLAICAHPQLQKVAQSAVAILTANEGVHSAAMNEMFTRQGWRGEGWTGSIADLRLAICAHPQLQKVAQSAVAILTANEGVHSAAMNEMFTRQDWRGEGWTGSMAVQRLH